MKLTLIILTLILSAVQATLHTNEDDFALLDPSTISPHLSRRAGPSRGQRSRENQDQTSSRSLSHQGPSTSGGISSQHRSSRGGASSSQQGPLSRGNLLTHSHSNSRPIHEQWNDGTWKVMQQVRWHEHERADKAAGNSIARTIRAAQSRNRVDRTEGAIFDANQAGDELTVQRLSKQKLWQEGLEWHHILKTSEERQTIMAEGRTHQKLAHLLRDGGIEMPGDEVKVPG